MPNADSFVETDSVPLVSPEGKKKPEGPRLRLANVKLLIALFIIFVLVTSEFFTNSVISGFGENAVRCRHPTSWGTVLQGIFLVLFYILMLHATESGII